MNLNGPPAPGAVEGVRTKLRHPLPSDYLAFLREHDGGEGWVGPHYLVLDRLDELPDFQDPWGEDSGPFVILGSDGGDELFAFDSREEMAVFMVPGVGGPQHAIYVAPSFTEFLHRLHRGDDLFSGAVSADPS
jgi:SMI1-KNR4 cell-wall